MEMGLGHERRASSVEHGSAHGPARHVQSARLVCPPSPARHRLPSSARQRRQAHPRAGERVSERAGACGQRGFPSGVR
jgi:hypothetical protein